MTSRSKPCVTWSLAIATAFVSLSAAGRGQQPPTMAQAPDPAAQVASIPERGRGTGGSCRFAGPLLRIPLSSAGGDGIVVRVSPPSSARYPEGAPIAVHGVSTIPHVEGSIACFSEAGFVDIGFLCQGSQSRPQPDGTVWRSGGTPPRDDCAEALSQVLAFATGNLHSTDGKSIHDYVPGIKVLTSNAGVVGWSFGGVSAVRAMAEYGDRFPGLKWYASWESPFVIIEGDYGNVFRANPFFDPKAGTIDFSRLRYAANTRLVFPPGVRIPEDRIPRGLLFLDVDGDGEFTTGKDFHFLARLVPRPAPNVFFTPMVLKEAKERNVFGSDWPAHIATVEQSEAFVREESATKYVAGAVQRFANLAVLVMESEQNHTDDSPDHAMTVAQVNAFVDSKVKWIRLNPDRYYVEMAMGRAPSRVVQNAAGERLRGESIRTQLVPENTSGGPTDKQLGIAAACELADRTYRNEWARTLSNVLVRPVRR